MYCLPLLIHLIIVSWKPKLTNTPCRKQQQQKQNLELVGVVTSTRVYLTITTLLTAKYSSGKFQNRKFEANTMSLFQRNVVVSYRVKISQRHCEWASICKSCSKPLKNQCKWSWTCQLKFNETLLTVSCLVSGLTASFFNGHNRQSYLPIQSEVRKIWLTRHKHSGKLLLKEALIYLLSC